MRRHSALFSVGATRLFDNALTDGERATLAHNKVRCVNGGKESYFSFMHTAEVATG